VEFNEERRRAKKARGKKTKKREEKIGVKASA